MERSWSLVGLMLGFLTLIWALQGVNFWPDEAHCSFPSDQNCHKSLNRFEIASRVADMSMWPSAPYAKPRVPSLSSVAYNQGSSDICNPCRRRHLALLSSSAPLCVEETPWASGHKNCISGTDSRGSVRQYSLCIAAMSSSSSARPC